MVMVIFYCRKLSKLLVCMAQAGSTSVDVHKQAWVSVAAVVVWEDVGGGDDVMP